MPASVVQTLGAAISSAKQASVSLTLSTPTTAGNAIVVSAIQAGASGFNTVADSKGNTYVKVIQSSAGTSETIASFIARDTAALAPGDTITLTSAVSTQYPVLTAYEFTPLSANADATTWATASTAAYSIPGVAIPAGDHLLIGVLGITGASRTQTPNGTWQKLGTAGDAAPSFPRTIMTMWDAQAGGTLAATGTFSVAAAWVGHLIALPAGGAAPAASNGAASGDVAWVGSAAGQKITAGLAAGVIAWAGVATGTAPTTPSSQGSASGSVSWQGVASGATSKAGSASGSLAWAGSATGTRTSAGQASGTLGWQGAAQGATARAGASSGALSWQGSAQGSTTRQGSAAGGVAWTGAAAGQAPSIGTASGHADGQVTWTGAAEGSTDAASTTTGAIVWAGLATGGNNMADVTVTASLTPRRWAAGLDGRAITAALADRRDVDGQLNARRWTTDLPDRRWTGALL
jgi:hypothetical protein